MAIQITLTAYHLLNEKNAVNKKLVNHLFPAIPNGIPLKGYLRDKTDIINPIVDITADSNTSTTSLLNINYFTIDVFRRSYFVNRYEFKSANCITFYLEEDVLSSYATNDSFWNLKAFIDRNETIYNPEVEDNLINFKFEKEVSYEVYDDKYYEEHTNLTRFNPSTNRPVVVWVYIGKDNDVSANVDYTPSEGDYETISPILSGSVEKCTNYQILKDNGEYTWILDELLNSETMRSFTKAMYILPIDLDYFPYKNMGDLFPQGQKFLNIGTERIDVETYSSAYIYLSVKSVITRLKVFDLYYNPSNVSFLDREPYTTYDIFLPYYGYAPIDSHNLIGKRIQVWYIINFDNGESQVQVLSESTSIVEGLEQSKNEIIFSAPCNLLLKASITGSNLDTINREKNSIALSTATGVISSTISLGLGIATGNPLLMGYGAAQMVGTAISNVSRTQQLIPRGETTCSSATDGFNMSQYVMIRKTKSKPIGYDENFFKIYGRPLKESKTFNELRGSGYTKIDNLHIESETMDEVECNLSIDEINKLEEVLRSGIIFNS